MHGDGQTAPVARSAASPDSQVGFWEWDFVTNRIVYSQEFFGMLGYRDLDRERIASEWDTYVQPDDLAGVRAAFDDYLTGRERNYEVIYRMRDAGGEYRAVRDAGWVVEWDENGVPARMIGRHTFANVIPSGEARPVITRAGTEHDKVGERQMAWQMANAIFEAYPYVFLLFDDKHRLVDCNMRAASFFGFPDKEALLAGFLPYIVKCIPPTQPNGLASVPLSERLNFALKHGEMDFETELLIGGRPMPLHIIFKRIQIIGKTYVAMYQTEMSLLSYTKDKLYRQDSLLQAANKIASMLMESTEREELGETIAVALRLLGESIGADRTHLWKNMDDNGMLTSSPLGCWAKTDKSAIDCDELREGLPFDDLLRGTAKGLRDDRNLMVRICADDVSPTLSMREADEWESLLLPVFLHGVFWGFIAFDNYLLDRRYTESEQSILRSITLMIASAVLRAEMLRNLIETREAALESTKAKSTFLSRMSHEIRTPMNAIIGMNTIARKTTDLSKIQYCLDKIEIASQQLLGIINDVLDMSKIEANKFEISVKETDFERMMQKVFHLVQVKMDEKHQEFTIDIPKLLGRTVVVDELRVTQVLINLLNNAIKFTPEYGHIAAKVRITDGAQGDAVLRVEVKDNGIGMTEEQRGRLFTAFQQADNTITRRFGGTGLGLAICKKIINLMGGDIWAESEPGKGSCFTFEFGFQWGASLAASGAQRPKLRKLRILVVDDAEDVLDYFTSILKSFSLTCETARNGMEAVRAVQKSVEEGNPFDFVFLDWRMPVMNGADTAREILRIMRNDVILVMISVADWSEIEDEVQDLGITRFLSKPVLPSALFNTILELTDRTVFYEKTDAPEARGRDWTGKHILLAEDIEINREIVANFLGDTGVEITCAENGLEAVAKYCAQPEQYDVILMDVQMPEMDGLEATRAIRASGLRTAHTIPIVAMTSNAFKEDVQACLSAGMNNHVAKPINVDDMMQKLTLYLC